MPDDANDAKFVDLPKKRLVLVLFRDLVAFPDAEANLHIIGDAYIDDITKDGFLIMSTPLEGETTIPEIGLLALVYAGKIKKRTEGNAASYSVPVRFLKRVEIRDIKAREKSGQGNVHNCAWSPFGYYEISEKIWTSNDFQKDLKVFKEAFNKVFSVVSGVVHFSIRELRNIKDEEGRQVEMTGIKKFLADLKELNKSANNVGRNEIASIVDKIAGHTSEFLFKAVPDDANLDPDILAGMRRILFSQSVEKRLEILTKILEYVGKDLSSLFIAKDGGEVLPESVREKIEKLSKNTTGDNIEAQMNRAYVAWLRRIPWNKSTVDETDFAKVRISLTRDHYGFKEVNELIVEFLAMRRVNPLAKGSILCFVGPPGVGKTSLGESIAKAIGRKFVRRSFGGVNDEAELKGHRRTYISSLPGCIIEGLCEAGVKDPVFMLDEVDKLGQHGGNIPAHALVEILDPEQNSHFRDHYIDEEVDLSQVLFILTANTESAIPDVLLDRMSVIELSGYTDDERLNIAEQYVFPKKIDELLITPDNLREKCLPEFTVDISREAMVLLVNDYTNDAGMRDTQKLIKKILAKILVAVQGGKTDIFEPEQNTDGADPKTQSGGSVRIVKITADNLKEYLEDPEAKEWMPDLGNPKTGVGNGLVVGRSGRGGVIPVEISVREANRFRLRATGNLGPVMEESVVVAYERLVRKGGALEGLSDKVSVHFHFDSNATQKEGPSAGIIAYTTLYSAVIGIPIKPYFAATGEITLQRDVGLPVGGIKAKLLAAKKTGVREVAIPFANKEDGSLKKFPMDGVRVIIPSDLAKENKRWRDFSREEKAPGTLTIYCFEKPEDVLELAFPDHYPLPEELKKKLLAKKDK